MENITMGNVIKEKRKVLGLTQKDLAEKLGVSDKAVSKWERNESLPDISLVPQIAFVLDISIDYLFCGNNTASDKEKSGYALHTDNEKTSSSYASVLVNKINFKYIIAIISVLFSVFFCLFGQITVLGNYISIMPWQYRPLFFSFLIVAVYFVFSMNIKKHRLMLCDTDCNTFEGNLDKVFIFAAVSGIYFIFLFWHIYGYALGNRLNDLCTIMAEMLGASAVKYGISVQFNNSTVISRAFVYFLSVVINIAVSEKRKTFSNSVYTTSAAIALLGILHTVYYGFVGAVILKNEAHMYAFWLETPKVIAVINKINVYNIIYTALILVVAALFIVFTRGRRSRKVCAICIVPLWIYHSISAFCLINRKFDGMGSCLAQLNNGSVFLSLAFIAAAPHIVMALNGLIKQKQ